MDDLIANGVLNGEMPVAASVRTKAQSKNQM